mmetsp:Transcript_54593/g.111423  ORF Transcript_54593/g.111423 Transcript_54593/m.111423 type:complete len:109 (-) Transcript_54593:84-410(-)
MTHECSLNHVKTLLWHLAFELNTIDRERDFAHVTCGTCSHIFLRRKTPFVHQFRLECIAFSTTTPAYSQPQPEIFTPLDANTFFLLLPSLLKSQSSPGASLTLFSSSP